MPYDEPRGDDPLELVGVELPTGGAEALREMAYAFAEEYAVLGWGRERLLKLFREPFYAGAHQAFRGLGEAEIGRIVDETAAAFGGVRFVVREPGRRRSLPVLPGDGGGDDR